MNISVEEINVEETIDDKFWTINTFVFIDLETTGLIKQKSFPKITELGLIAVSRDNFLNCENGIPRVLHKLALSIHPQTDIPPIVQRITEMSSEKLKNEENFNNNVYVIFKHFITRLKEPICFVAHNGYQFDFPVLLHELNLIKTDYFNDLPHNLLCLDTLFGFKEILKNSPQVSPSKNVVMASSSPPNDHTYPKTANDSNLLINNGSDNSKKQSTPKKMIANYKLATLYKYFYGHSADLEHRAESDCLALLQCCLKVKNQFVNWADMNADYLQKYALFEK